MLVSGFQSKGLQASKGPYSPSYMLGNISSGDNYMLQKYSKINHSNNNGINNDDNDSGDGSRGSDENDSYDDGMMMMMMEVVVVLFMIEVLARK